MEQISAEPVRRNFKLGGFGNLREPPILRWLYAGPEPQAGRGRWPSAGYIQRRASRRNCGNAAVRSKDGTRIDYSQSNLLLDFQRIVKGHTMRHEKYTANGIVVERTEIISEEAAKEIGRKCGLYTTIHMGRLDKISPSKELCDCLVQQLQPYLEAYWGKNLLICGIGNPSRSFDALGNATAKLIMPNLYEELNIPSVFTKVAVVCPDILGQSNLKPDTAIAGIVSSIDASCVLAIDSCCCSNMERLCSCIYISDTGMKTYWGSTALNRSTVGVPVISIGVPTSIHAKHLSSQAEADLLLTPVLIADVIRCAAYLIASAVIQIGYPEVSFLDCKTLLENAIMVFSV